MKLLKFLWPYCALMRLDKPIGFELVFWPAAWALWLSSSSAPKVSVLLIFICGALVMRSAGCIINDLLDRGFDGSVARTSQRPLVTGEANVFIAWLLFVLLCAVGFWLVLQLNILCLYISLFVMLLIMIYPLCKRWLMFPQFVLGVVFNSGVLLAYAAIQNKLPWPAWVLFGCSWLWTVAYDTFYAMADRDDDLKIGVKSTAIWFGKYDLLVVGGLQFFMILGLVFLGVFLGLGWFYYVTLGCSCVLFAYQNILCRGYNPKHCFKAFLNNHWVGVLIFIGILVAH